MSPECPRTCTAVSQNSVWLPACVLGLASLACVLVRRAVTSRGADHTRGSFFLSTWTCSLLRVITLLKVPTSPSFAPTLVAFGIRVPFWFLPFYIPSSLIMSSSSLLCGRVIASRGIVIAADVMIVGKYVLLCVFGKDCATDLSDSGFGSRMLPTGRLCHLWEECAPALPGSCARVMFVKSDPFRADTAKECASALR